MRTLPEQAFTILPRNGALQGAVWVTRIEEENRIRDIFAKQGKSICLDGPTGTGKSSIALTAASENNCHFLRIQLVRSLDWPTFATLVLDLLAKKRVSTKDQIRFGFARFLPEFSFQREKIRGGDVLYKILDFEVQAKDFTLHQLAYVLSTLDVVLILDDFEKASTELLHRFADLSKLLTDTFRAPKARILFVGTHDIYRRLRSSDEALSGRLEQVSVGTLGHGGHSWAYLAKGFESLGFYHPGRTKFKSSIKITDVIESVYEAANGLLKSLSDLGKAITLRTQSNTINSKTISDECKRLLQQSIRDYENDFPGFVNDIMHSPGKKLLMKWLFKSGVGKIHNLDNMMLKAQLAHEDQAQVNSAYESFCAQGFLVAIGHNAQNKTFYVTDPRFAHVFGVICTHHDKYEIHAEICKITGQLELPFYMLREDSPWEQDINPEGQAS